MAIKSCARGAVEAGCRESFSGYHWDEFGVCCGGGCVEEPCAHDRGGEKTEDRGQMMEDRVKTQSSKVKGEDGRQRTEDEWPI